MRVKPVIQAPPVDAGRSVNNAGPCDTVNVPEKSTLVSAEFMTSGSAFQRFVSS